jgi:hypothetical protein
VRSYTFDRERAYQPSVGVPQQWRLISGLAAAVEEGSSSVHPSVYALELAPSRLLAALMSRLAVGCGLKIVGFSRFGNRRSQVQVAAGMLGTAGVDRRSRRGWSRLRDTAGSPGDHVAADRWLPSASTCGDSRDFTEARFACRGLSFGDPDRN